MQGGNKSNKELDRGLGRNICFDSGRQLRLSCVAAAETISTRLAQGQSSRFQLKSDHNVIIIYHIIYLFCFNCVSLSADPVPSGGWRLCHCQTFPTACHCQTSSMCQNPCQTSSTWQSFCQTSSTSKALAKPLRKSSLRRTPFHAPSATKRSAYSTCSLFPWVSFGVSFWVLPRLVLWSSGWDPSPSQSFANAFGFCLRVSDVPFSAPRRLRFWCIFGPFPRAALCFAV